MIAAATAGDVMMAIAFMGGAAMIIAMVLNYFRWFYTKTPKGQDERDRATGRHRPY